MDIVFLKVFNMSIAASWLILAVIVVRLLLKKVPKWISCVLWALVAIRLMCPFSMESFLSLVPSAETIPPEIVYSQEPAISSGISYLNSMVNPVIGETLAPEPGDSISPMKAGVSVAAGVWFAGMVILLVYAGVSYLRLRYKVRFAVRLQYKISVKSGGHRNAQHQPGKISFAGHEPEQVGSAAPPQGENGLAASQPVQSHTSELREESLWQSEYVASPFILGMTRPRIYLPFGLEGTQLDCVVAHEKAHLARGDHWWKPLGFLLLSIYWFNPLCWVAYCLLCKDIELACDEKVVKKLSSQEKKVYSETLLFGSVNRRTIAVCPLAFGEVGVKERVRNVLYYKKPAFWVLVAAAVICVVIALCFLTNPRKEASSDLPDLREESFGVAEVVYDDGRFSYIYIPSEGPKYYISRDNHLMYMLGVPNSNGGWQDMGQLTAFSLTKKNFDDYLQDSGAGIWASGLSARKIRRENVNAWYVIEETVVGDSALSILYYVLQQENGELYLAYGYANEPEEENMIRWLLELARAPIEQLPADYSLEDAVQDGCVVIADGDVMSGQDIWAEFVETTAAGHPAAVRVAKYYTLGDKSRYDAAYYESIKDEYPKLFVFDLCYDGYRYAISHYEEDKLYVSNYEYLMRYEGEPTSPTATFDTYVRYVLVDDPEVTWEEIERGMFSSQLGDGVKHTSIYVDLE